MNNKQPPLLPGMICLLCGNECSDSLCTPCRQDLPYSKKTCPKCARPVVTGQICSNCLRKPPVISQCIVLYDYVYPVDQLIREMKFHQRPEIIQCLGQELNSRICMRIGFMPDILVPVPLHQIRMLQRGYNQALELARVLRRYSGIPVDHRGCRRIRNSPPQSRVPAKLRRENVAGVFQVPEKIRYRHVMIVDDVITTGSTVSEIASRFLQSGCRYVSACALARAGSLSA